MVLHVQIEKNVVYALFFALYNEKKKNSKNFL